MEPHENEWPVFDATLPSASAYGTGAWDRMWLKPDSRLATWTQVAAYALTIDGYAYAEQRCEDSPPALADLHHRLNEIEGGGVHGPCFEELRYLLFLWQRAMRHWECGPGGDEDRSANEGTGLRIYMALCNAWQREHLSHLEELRRAYRR